MIALLLKLWGYLTTKIDMPSDPPLLAAAKRSALIYFIALAVAIPPLFVIFPFSGCTLCTWMCFPVVLLGVIGTVMLFTYKNWTITKLTVIIWPVFPMTLTFAIVSGGFSTSCMYMSMPTISLLVATVVPTRVGFMASVASAVTCALIGFVCDFFIADWKWPTHFQPGWQRYIILLLLVTCSVMNVAMSWTVNQKMIADMRTAEALARRIATLQLETALDEIENKMGRSSMQQSFLGIVRVLMEYRNYLPAGVVLAAAGLDHSSDDDDKAVGEVRVLASKKGVANRNSVPHPNLVTTPMSNMPRGSNFSEDEGVHANDGGSSPASSGRSPHKYRRSTGNGGLPQATLSGKSGGKASGGGGRRGNEGALTVEERVRDGSVVELSVLGYSKIAQLGLKSLAEFYQLWLDVVLEVAREWRGVADPFLEGKLTVSFNILTRCGAHVDNALIFARSVVDKFEVAAQERAQESHTKDSFWGQLRVVAGVSSGPLRSAHLGCTGMKRLVVVGSAVTRARQLRRLAEAVGQSERWSLWTARRAERRHVSVVCDGRTQRQANPRVVLASVGEVERVAQFFCGSQRWREQLCRVFDGADVWWPQIPGVLSSATSPGSPSTDGFSSQNKDGIGEVWTVYGLKNVDNSKEQEWMYTLAQQAADDPLKPYHRALSCVGTESATEQLTIVECSGVAAMFLDYLRWRITQGKAVGVDVRNVETVEEHEEEI